MEVKNDKEIIQLSRRTVYQNRWMQVNEDKVLFPAGFEGIYGVVEKPPFAIIIPVHSDGRIQMVQQFRYPIGQRCWELPQGAWEDTPDSDPETLARGELAEETGYRAGRMEKIGEMFPAGGLLNQLCHIFLAHDLTEGATSREATETDMETAAFSMDEILAMFEKGAMPDANSMAALGYWKMKAGLCD
ncbi:NUDIX hydrolase [uncultured Cohaesibacter sp.]|uniref:NUDIX hydrolase n=1 Tax=uncultured Cohaesibacter sp. TaxID=1002546 RepID=UPI002AAAF4F3|nr:NUDIX hydrolase [uncultured Cohaesibacter sp.]